MIYKNSDYNNDWDGIEGNAIESDAKIIPLGTYYYLASIKGTNGKANMTKGYLTII